MDILPVENYSGVKQNTDTQQSNSDQVNANHISHDVNGTHDAVNKVITNFDTSHQDITTCDNSTSDVSQHGVSNNDIGSNCITNNDISQRDITTNAVNHQDITSNGVNHSDVKSEQAKITPNGNLTTKDNDTKAVSVNRVLFSDLTNSNIVNGMLKGDINAGTEVKLPGRPLSVTYKSTNTCVVGLRNELLLQVTYDDEPKRVIRTKFLHVKAEDSEPRQSIICQLKPSRKGTRVWFWPKAIGLCNFTVQSDGCQDFRFSVEVEGNNPVLSFSEDNDWPVAISVRQDDHSIFIAFMHHVSRYSKEGDFVREVVREKVVHFNDIAVDQMRHKLAVSVSGWRKDGTHKFRYQAVRLYSLTGTPLWAVGRQHPLFGVSIIRIAFDPRGNLLVASKGALCTCARSTGVVDRRVEATFGTAARMAITDDGHVVVADGNLGHIYVFDADIRPKTDFRVHLEEVDPGNDSVVGLTGLAVDRFGHILVSECLTSSIRVFTLEGTLLVLIDSEWDFCKWPLSLAVSRDGHVFVVDHGNACIKKYRYM